MAKKIRLKQFLSLKNREMNIDTNIFVDFFFKCEKMFLKLYNFSGVTWGLEKYAMVEFLRVRDTFKFLVSKLRVLEKIIDKNCFVKRQKFPRFFH